MGLRHLLLSFLLLVSGGAAGVWADDGERFSFEQRHMGVLMRLTFYAADRATAERVARAAFDRVAQLDRIMSDYDPESELSQLSRSAPSARPVPVSQPLWTVLRAAQSLSVETGGAFDVTVGPLSRLWRRARRRRQMPSERRLAEARAAVGYRHLRLDDSQKTATLRVPDMRLDLGGIAKGFAADEACRVLREAGIRSALVDASGDLRLADPPPNQPGWKVGIAPLSAAGPPSQMLIVANCGVATSGDAWQYVEIDGTRYSHILDPRTGLGLTRRSSVTIIAPDCLTADSLASAVSVLGPQAGLELVEAREQVAAFIVQARQGQRQQFESKGYRALVEQSGDER